MCLKSQEYMLIALVRGVTSLSTTVTCMTKQWSPKSDYRELWKLELILNRYKLSIDGPRSLGEIKGSREERTINSSWSNMTRLLLREQQSPTSKLRTRGVGVGEGGGGGGAAR